MPYAIRVSNPPEGPRPIGRVTTDRPGIRLARLLCLVAFSLALSGTTHEVGMLADGLEPGVPQVALVVSQGAPQERETKVPTAARPQETVKERLSVCINELSKLRASSDTCRIGNDRQAQLISDLTGRLKACRAARPDDKATTEPTPPRRLVGWFRNALGRIAEQALGFGGADCRTVAVDYDPTSGQVEIRLHTGTTATDPDTALEQDLGRTLTGLFPELKVRIERAPLPRNCAPPPSDRTSGPMTDPEPTTRGTSRSGPDTPEPDSSSPTPRGPDSALPGYQIRFDRYGEAALVPAQRLSPNERNRLPNASDCATLGPEFEQAVPVAKRSVPAFLVGDGNRTVACTKSGSDWHVQRNTFSPIEAHLLLKE